MYFFRTFKKSTAPYKVHNMGLRYIKNIQQILEWKIKNLKHNIIQDDNLSGTAEFLFLQIYAPKIRYYTHIGPRRGL